MAKYARNGFWEVWDINREIRLNDCYRKCNGGGSSRSKGLGAFCRWVIFAPGLIQVPEVLYVLMQK